jgi:hypothetical protein
MNEMEQSQNIEVPETFEQWLEEQIDFALCHLSQHTHGTRPYREWTLEWETLRRVLAACERYQYLRAMDD